MSEIISRSLGLILLAGGLGERFVSSNKLLYRLRDGQSVFQKSLSLFLNCLPRLERRNITLHPIVIVSHPQWQDAYREEVNALDNSNKPPIIWAVGGNSRQASVLNGLTALQSLSPDYVVIHDAARPLCHPENVHTLIRETLHQDLCGASLAVPCHDTLKRTHPDGRILETVPRENIWRVQTPQCFRYPVLLAAHQSLGSDIPVTDDLQLLEEAGQEGLKLIIGDDRNIKITTLEDIALANALL
jgi:2-C-methyl-D-erythritol 4-phosphate cytidylyltransferase / 2-C-methyl-D-erythritol 2,4-cyclodiphosphate synthase